MRVPTTVADELELGPELTEVLRDAERARNFDDLISGITIPAVCYAIGREAGIKATMPSAAREALHVMARTVNLLAPDTIRQYTHHGRAADGQFVVRYIIAESDTDALDLIPKNERTDVGAHLVCTEI